MRRGLVLTTLLATLGAGVTPAAAVIRVARDTQGRAIRFDVQAPNVDLAAYTRIMRTAVHGDEIGDVTIRIVPPGRVGQVCGAADASGCYGGFPRRIVVPAGSGAAVEHVLLHEYGHHVDHTLHHGGLPEPNGTSRWWRARSMAQRLRRGQVAFDYRLGWNRAVGEIFAEDYVQLHVRTSHGIGWLRPPTTAVLRAMRLDLTGRASGAPPRTTTPATPAPVPDPPAGTTPPGTEDPSGGQSVTTRRTGIVEAGERRTLPFGLLGPGRRVTFTVRLSTISDVPVRVRAELVCDGAVVAVAEGGEGQDAAIDRPGLGPGQCEVALVGVEGAGVYDATLTLTRPPSG